MRISYRFVARLKKDKLIKQTQRIDVRLRGSLAFTGVGHGSPRACLYGLMGFRPKNFDSKLAAAKLEQLYDTFKLKLRKGPTITMDPEKDIILDYDTQPDLHPNEMALRAYDGADKLLLERIYYSTGGGFIASRDQLLTPVENDIVSSRSTVPNPFGSAADLLSFCNTQNQTISQIIYSNEDAMRPREDTDAALDNIATVMMACIDRGLETSGTLPGGLNVMRRAPDLWQKLNKTPLTNEPEQLFDWLNVYAMAVNEENANGGQVVTAPTNGAAGIIPAILKHYCSGDNASPQDIRKFLLTAGGIGLLYKQRASISGAEMGCQGEVGVACSMAAGGLAALWGGNPQQVAQAAEIGMEHNLGLTCDPVGGLVQIPCIERNAIGTVKAVNAARLALHASGPMKVSLDQVIETMRQTGLDMSSKYKETSQGGLAVNVIEC